MVLFAACVALGAGEKNKADVGEGGSKQKRGLLGLGYGGDGGDGHYDEGLGYGTLGGYGLGSSIDSGFSNGHHYHQGGQYPTHIHTATTITKSVPVPQPYPVTVEKHVPYPVAAPYPVEVPKPYPVAVPKPYPVAVAKPYAVPVDRPYPVPVPQPYPVPVVKHVGIPVHHAYPLQDFHRPYPALSALSFHKPLYSDRDFW